MLSRGAGCAGRVGAASVAEPTPQPVHLHAQLPRLRIGKARGTAPLALPEPGRDPADEDAANQQHQHQKVERQRPRERGMARIEGIEGKGDVLAVCYRQADDDDRKRQEDQCGENLAEHDLRSMCD